MNESRVTFDFRHAKSKAPLEMADEFEMAYDLTLGKEVKRDGSKLTVTFKNRKDAEDAKKHAKQMHPDTIIR